MILLEISVPLSTACGHNCILDLRYRDIRSDQIDVEYQIKSARYARTHRSGGENSSHAYENGEYVPEIVSPSVRSLLTMLPVCVCDSLGMQLTSLLSNHPISFADVINRSFEMLWYFLFTDEGISKLYVYLHIRS